MKEPMYIYRNSCAVIKFDNKHIQKAMGSMIEQMMENTVFKECPFCDFIPPVKNVKFTFVKTQRKDGDKLFPVLTIGIAVT